MLTALDVPCETCNALAGIGCRAWSRMLSPMRRVHRSRAQRFKQIRGMHHAALTLFGEWPTEAEVELLARLGDGEERDRAAYFLSLLEATGYEGELFNI